MASSESLDFYMRELLQREMSGERDTIEVGPYTAMQLVAAIQWAIRRGHPGEQGPAQFEQVLDQLKRIFVEEPAAAALIQLYEPPLPQ